MKRTRTFVAVEASASVRAMAGKLVARLQTAFADVKWVADQNLHWTLQFLGDVEDLAIPEVCRAVAAAAAEQEVFSLSTCEIGVFPNSARPRILWIGAGPGAECMIDLQHAIEQRLTRLGFRGENRRFVPHLTIGRFGRRDDVAKLAAEWNSYARPTASDMPVEEVTVFASRLAKSGSVYEPLSRAPLSG